MIRSFVLLTFSLTVAFCVVGCASEPVAFTPKPAAPPSTPDVIATVKGHPITADQVQKPLVENFGLELLLQVMQLELAKDKAAELHITVTDDDLKQELARSLAMLFKNTEKVDYEQLIGQILQEQRMTRPVFDLYIQTNAYLRKILEPSLKNSITEAHLKEAFGFLYGETAEVRHIQCSNLQELAEAQRRLQAGEKFEAVARAMSRDPSSAARGGLLPPFSREAQSRQKAFKDAAFSLEVGQVSQPVQAGDAYHLIKLEQKIMPKAVKFDDPEMKNMVRDWVYNNMMFTAMNTLRNELAVTARENIDIRDPVLKAQYEQKVQQHAAKIKDRDDVRHDLEQERKQAATRATIPTTAPAPKPPTTAPATAP